MNRSTTAQKLSIWILLGICVALGVVLVLTVKGKHEDDRQNKELLAAQGQISFGLRETQFENCLKSGNVLREQIRHEFVGLKRDVLIPVFQGVAVTIPPSPARDVLDEAVAYMHKRIKTIDERIPDADCLELYPPLPGQGYPPDLIRQALREKS